MPIWQNQFRQLMLVRVSDYHVDAGQSGNLVRRSLGIAPGDYNSGFRILAADAANGGAGVLIGARGDSASIQNDDGCALGA